MKDKPISERDLVIVPDRDTQKPRPGIVIQITADRTIILVAGTGTPRDLPRVEVRPERREGKRLGFYKPTYFYVSGRRAVLESEVIVTEKTCSMELFLELRELIDRGSC